MKNGNTQETILPVHETAQPASAVTAEVQASKPRKKPVVSTTALLGSLVQTLDVEQFLRDVQELDAVTRRQCLLRALRDLAGAGAIRLHGSRKVRKVIRRLQAEQPGA